jgi:hypothetical protein
VGVVFTTLTGVSGSGRDISKLQVGEKILPVKIRKNGWNMSIIVVSPY